MSEYESRIISVIVILRAMYRNDLDGQEQYFTPQPIKPRQPACATLEFAA